MNRRRRHAARVVSRSFLALAAFVLAAIPPAIRAAEPWADDRLTDREGLILWLDASRRANSTPPNDGSAIDAWIDASGHERYVTQPDEKSRPKFIAAKDKSPAAISFDGNDDSLTINKPLDPLKQLTLVMVAAPRSVHPDFRGLFSASANDKNDYTSGLNVDLGPAGSLRFDTINVEGAGAGGFVNLLDGHPSLLGFEMNTFHAIALTVADGPGGVALRVDGQPAGKRDRAPGSAIAADHLLLGARRYSNEPPKPPYVRSFFNGRIAEVLLYDRVLSPEEIGRVEKYLNEKYPVLAEAAVAAPPLPGTRPLVPVKDPPAVQMFVPGFTVKRLPLELNNVNNLRYRADGKLLALAYDGNVYVLRDTNGDGLEDKADLFWDNQGRIQSPIGMTLTPPGYPRGDGVFIANKGKLSLVVDTDKDDKADQEIVVATGWPMSFHQVDTLGVAIDPKDQSIYFGIGTANFADPLLKDKDGVAHYDLKGERGTILRASPDFSKREIVCTGIRFPVGLMFNAAGDLFCTDQEGATWVPNGNPLDELLHIQPSRHYGFPARHPKFVPNVIDEPSTFDYAPQHQSTCGLFFNETVNAGPVFGPDTWRGDALVTGYSRGKLYRTKLVKTPAGYIAQNHLIASSTMMLSEAAVTPTGDLVVAAHGGKPDWGSGPAGKGALFKIVYTDRVTPKPQPVITYPAGPREVRVAFDKPLDPAALRGLGERASIDFGEAVAAGDQFEILRPGYDAVKRQLLSPRFALAVQSVAMTADRRTLVIQTDPMSPAVGYGLSLPGPADVKPRDDGQLDTTELAYDLTGVETTWTPAGEVKPVWAGWLPHVDLSTALPFTAGSAEHNSLSAAMKKPGTLKLRAQLDLADMLRPAIQPGSKIDYEWPAETTTVTFATSDGNTIDVKTPDGIAVERKPPSVSFTVTSAKAWLPVEVTLTTQVDGSQPTKLDVTFHTAEDARPRPLPLRRVILPWAKPPGDATRGPTIAPAEPHALPAELAGGNWARGRKVFHSEQAMCAKCHRLREDGVGKIGPDLSNLHHRDYASVYQDVVFPSAAINPDHVTYAITLNDGNVMAGVPRPDGEGAMIVGEPGGKETRVERANIKSMEPLDTSIMPHGIDQTIGAAALKDLMTFLLMPPLEPAKIERPDPPPARTRAEVDAILPPRGVGVPPAASKNKNVGEKPVPQKTLRILLAAGPKDHGPGEHDYPAWQKQWTQLLSRAENVEIDTAFGWPDAKQFENSDVIVFYSANPGWAADKVPQLDAYLKRGGGLVYVHYAVDGRDAVEPFAERIGLAWRGGASKFRHGPLDLEFTEKDHPITRGFSRVSFVDESYWQLIGDARRPRVLATGIEENRPQPLLWTHEPFEGKGRVFVSIPGHYAWTFDDPLFRILLLRGIAWCARDADVERLTPLATIGARMATGK